MDQAYSMVSGEGFADKCGLRVRLKMYDSIAKKIDLSRLDTILDVGVTADKEKSSSNFFESSYPFKDRITAISDQDASWLEDAYPGLKFVPGDGKNLPFSDNSFDLVFSSAVIEHVGSEEEQEQFILESFRVSRKYVVLTTPNRWHPVEFHTTLPFLHWLPKPLHRIILKRIGMTDLSLESNLNLLDTRTLKTICARLKIANHHISFVRFMYAKSNLILFIEK